MLQGWGLAQAPLIKHTQRRYLMRAEDFVFQFDSRIFRIALFSLKSRTPGLELFLQRGYLWNDGGKRGFVICMVPGPFHPSPALSATHRTIAHLLFQGLARLCNSLLRCSF